MSVREPREQAVSEFGEGHGWFRRVPGEARPHPVRNGAIFLAIVAFVLIAGYGGQIPFLPQGGYTVRAVFANVADLGAHSPVRVDGVNVGEVTHVTLAPGGGALTTMKITDNGFKLHSDARAAVLWRTLLGGNFYIQLDPGSRSAPLLGNNPIPLSRTISQSELDQVLLPFNDKGRQSVRTFIKTFDQGFRDNHGVPSTIDALAPAMRPIGPALQALRGSQRGDLPALVANASRVLGALSASEVDLGGLISNADTTLGVTAAREAALGSTLDQAPSTEQNSIATMTRLRATFDQLDPLATALIPGVRTLAPAATIAQPALARMRALLADASPLLRSLQPALRRLAGAAGAGLPLITGLTPTLRRAQTSLLPWLDKVDPGTKLHNYAAIGPFFATLDSAAESYDVNGHALDFSTAPGENASVDSPCQTYFTNPTATQKVDCAQLMSVIAKVFGGGLPAGKVR